MSDCRPPAVLFLDTQGGTHQMDGESWGPADLDHRDLAMAIALTALSLRKLRNEQARRQENKVEDQDEFGL